MNSILATLAIIALLAFIIIGLSDWRPYFWLEIGDRTWVLGNRAAYEQAVADEEAEIAEAMRRHPAGSAFHVEQYRAYGEREVD